jgi:hypothetical protein
MDRRPLVNEQIEVGEEFVRRFHNYMPVKAAFWVKPADVDRWDLYIAADQIGDGDLRPAHMEVFRLAGELQDPYLDPFRVWLIPGDDRLTRAVLDAHWRSHGKKPIRYFESMLDGMAIDGAYLYPLPDAVAAT